jgi:hypothetical protein
VNADRSKLRATSSAERTLDARDLAAMRPVVQPARKPKTASRPALREVTSGIVCFCGERFGEAQALEFMLHLRAEVGEELGVLRRLRTRSNDYRRRRYAEDEEFRTKKKASSRRSKQKRQAESSRKCECGCGEMTKGGRVKPGHLIRTADGRFVAGETRRKRFACRSCEVCGTVFEPWRDNAKWCSRSCQNRARDESSKYRETALCPVCDTEFQRDKYTKKPMTCSRRCGGKFGKRHLTRGDGES